MIHVCWIYCIDTISTLTKREGERERLYIQYIFLVSLWYNAMEFARAGAMIADDVFGFKTPYTLPIHNEMKHSQAGDAGDMVFKNRETFHKLSRRISKKQWTWVSAWVANCEFRQTEKSSDQVHYGRCARNMITTGSNCVPSSRCM